MNPEAEHSAEAPEEAPNIALMEGTDFDPRARVLALWESFKATVRSERIQQILLTMARSPHSTMTQREIYADARQYGYPAMTNGSRISELVRAGALVMVGERVCRVTGRKVACYSLTGAVPDKVAKECAPRLTFYAALKVTPRGLEWTRIETQNFKPGPDELLVVAPVNRMQSSKLADGTSALPTLLPPLNIGLGSRDAISRPLRHPRKADDGQAQLFAEA